MRQQIIESVEKEKLIAIVRGVGADQCRKVAQALYEGGVRLMEITYDQRAPETWAATAGAIGALAHYVSDSTVASFQPMNVNFGIIAPLGQRVRGKANKNLAIANRSLAHLEAMEK